MSGVQYLYLQLACCPQKNLQECLQRLHMYLCTENAASWRSTPMSWTDELVSSSDLDTSFLKPHGNACCTFVRHRQWRRENIGWKRRILGIDMQTNSTVEGFCLGRSKLPALQQAHGRKHNPRKKSTTPHLLLPLTMENQFLARNETHITIIEHNCKVGGTLNLLHFGHAWYSTSHTQKWNVCIPHEAHLFQFFFNFEKFCSHPPHHDGDVSRGPC